MLKHLRKIVHFASNIHTCLLIMVLLSVTIVSCDKQITHDEIEGTWVLTTDPSCRWTFVNPYGQGGDHAFLIINKLDTFRDIKGYYEIDANAIKIFSYYNSFHYSYIVYDDMQLKLEVTYLTVDHISKNKLCLSGTIRLVSTDSNRPYIYEKDIVYEFTKTLKL